MGNQTQNGSRPSSGKKIQKSPHDKAKSKTPQHRSEGKLFHKETPEFSINEVAEKAFSGLSNLGGQIFAVSPFTQYFDDWLVNVRGVILEFESNPVISVDEDFLKVRSQIFTDVDRELAEKRLKEDVLEEAAAALSEAKNLIVQLDADYAAQTRTLSQKKSSEVEFITKSIHNLDEGYIFIEQTKTSFFNPFSKRTKVQKLAEVNQRLTTAKSNLDATVQNFGVEQEKLRDEYTNKKQATIEKIQSLEKEIIHIETDNSAETRQTACTALTNAITALLQRKTVPVS